MIVLQETANEYLLSIPYYQRSRVKAIAGRKWDTRRTVWVYPRNLDSYKALLAEFGEELRGNIPSQPNEFSETENSPETENGPETENAINQLADNIIEQVVRRIPMEDMELLRTTIKEKEESLRIINDENQLLKNEINHLRLNIGADNHEVSDDIFTLAGNVAAEAAKDPNFEELGPMLRSSPTVVVELGKRIEMRIREIVDADQANNFFDVLSKARELDLISKEAFSLGHTLRTMRNIVAHLELDENTITARSLIALFSAALIWQELPRE